ncbi:MAG: metallophosphoesterase family protein [Prochlorothrix sp.]|nr:metallophosphoesterase [Prochlorothrix sp.]
MNIDPLQIPRRSAHLGWVLLWALSACGPQPLAQADSQRPPGLAAPLITASPVPVTDDPIDNSTDNTTADNTTADNTATDSVPRPADHPALVPNPDLSPTTRPSPTPPLPKATQALLNQLPQAPLNPPPADFRFAVISDLNRAYGSTTYDPSVTTTVNLLPYWRPDLVLCSGDMVAGQSLSLSDDEVTAMWTAFDQLVAEPLRSAGIPFGFTLGNHDASAAPNGAGGYSFQRDRDQAAAYWQTPAHDPGVNFVDRSQFPFYYSFTAGPADEVFFLVWDGSTHIIPPAQLAWVDQALQSSPAQQAQFRFLIGHLPLYAVAEGRNRPGEVMANSEQLRTLLERHQVHTYISGHHHAYYPGQRGQLDLLHTGLIGSGPRPLIDQSTPSPKTLTLLDLDTSQGQLTYTTYNAETWEVIALETLPRFLLGHNGRVRRRDVAPSDLTAPEQSRCEARLGAALCRD